MIPERFCKYGLLQCSGISWDFCGQCIWHCHLLVINAKLIQLMLIMKYINAAGQQGRGLVALHLHAGSDVNCVLLPVNTGRWHCPPSAPVLDLGNRTS